MSLTPALTFHRAPSNLVRKNRKARNARCLGQIVTRVMLFYQSFESVALELAVTLFIPE